MNTQRWVKVSGPGQFRGQGEWTRFEDTNYSEADWDYFKSTGFLPTHEGENPPEGEA